MSSLPEECRGRLLSFGVSSNSSDADYLLAPSAALKASTDHQNVLLVFDDSILHKFKEKLVYDLAS